MQQAYQGATGFAKEHALLLPAWPSFILNSSKPTCKRFVKIWATQQKQGPLDACSLLQQLVRLELMHLL